MYELETLYLRKLLLELCYILYLELTSLLDINLILTCGTLTFVYQASSAINFQCKCSFRTILLFSFLAGFPLAE